MAAWRDPPTHCYATLRLLQFSCAETRTALHAVWVCCGPSLLQLRLSFVSGFKQPLQKGRRAVQWPLTFLTVCECASTRSDGPQWQWASQSCVQWVVLSHMITGLVGARGRPFSREETISAFLPGGGGGNLAGTTNMAPVSLHPRQILFKNPREAALRQQDSLRKGSVHWESTRHMCFVSEWIFVCTGVGCRVLK